MTPEQAAAIAGYASCAVALVAAGFAWLQAAAARRANQIARQAPWAELVMEWVKDECIKLAEDRVRFLAFVEVPHRDVAAKREDFDRLLALRRSADAKMHQLAQFEPKAQPLLETRRKLCEYESFFENTELLLSQTAQSKLLADYNAAYSEHLATIRRFAAALANDP